MKHAFIDDIVAQTAIQPGDLLIFDGEGQNPGFGRRLQAKPISFAQKKFFKSPFSPTYIHSAVCSGVEGNEVTITHLKDTGVCSGALTTESRDIKTAPFSRPFIIIRPPADLGQLIREEAEARSNQQVIPSKTAYFKTLFGKSKPDTAPVYTGLQGENTCVGFVINIVSLASAKIDRAYPLAVETATVELLKHTAKSNDGEWKMLLVPGYKMTRDAEGNKHFEPTDLIDLIKTFINDYITALYQRKLNRGTIAKISDIELVINNFKTDTEKSNLDNGRHLLEALKPVMTKARFWGQSDSFDRLLKQVKPLGIYKDYLLAKK